MNGTDVELARIAAGALLGHVALGLLMFERRLAAEATPALTA